MTILGSIVRTLLALFSRDRLPLIGLSFIVLLASTFVGTFSPPDPNLAKQLEETLKLYEQYGPLVILINNGLVSIIMMIPLLGLGQAIYIAYTTGVALASIASLAGMDPLLSLLFTLVMPHTIMEFLAYSMALTENLALCQRILTRKDLDKELRYLVATLVMVALMLTAAMLVETATIGILSGGA